MTSKVMISSHIRSMPFISTLNRNLYLYPLSRQIRRMSIAPNRLHFPFQSMSAPCRQLNQIFTTSKQAKPMSSISKQAKQSFSTSRQVKSMPPTISRQVKPVSAISRQTKPVSTVSNGSWYHTMQTESTISLHTLIYGANTSNYASNIECSVLIALFLAMLGRSTLANEDSTVQSTSQSTVPSSGQSTGQSTVPSSGQSFGQSSGQPTTRHSSFIQSQISSNTPTESNQSMNNVPKTDIANLDGLQYDAKFFANDIMSETMAEKIQIYLKTRTYKQTVSTIFGTYADQYDGCIPLECVFEALVQLHAAIVPSLHSQVLEDGLENCPPSSFTAAKVNSLVQSTKFTKDEFHEWLNQADLHDRKELFYPEFEFLARNVVFTTVVVARIVQMAEGIQQDQLKGFLYTLGGLMFVAASYGVYTWMQKKRPPRPPRLSPQIRARLLQHTKKT